jgi:integrase
VKPKRREQPIRYLTLDQWRLFLESVDRLEHKLMFRVCDELGCRVGELVRIQAKHLDFRASTVFIPAENTKTGVARTSHLPRELMNDVRHALSQRGVIGKRDGNLRKPDAFLFESADRRRKGITENRVRQVFRHYAERAGLQREYGTDSQGRKLWRFSVHSLRHTHCMHYIHVHKLPVPVVQRQVGHRTLDATMV